MIKFYSPRVRMFFKPAIVRPPDIVRDQTHDVVVPSSETTIARIVKTTRLYTYRPFNNWPRRKDYPLMRRQKTARRATRLGRK